MALERLGPGREAGLVERPGEIEADDLGAEPGGEGPHVERHETVPPDLWDPRPGAVVRCAGLGGLVA